MFPPEPVRVWSPSSADSNEYYAKNITGQPAFPASDTNDANKIENNIDRYNNYTAGPAVGYPGDKSRYVF
jgi:hypothetical protein